jgi:hypothetical protein
VPRGIRNNNPLNIRRGVQWRGLRDFATDKAFCEFKSMDYGFRAAFCILRTYFSKRGVRTLRQLISRWAPPTENNTEAYIRKVRLLSSQREGYFIELESDSTPRIPVSKTYEQAVLARFNSRV